MSEPDDRTEAVAQARLMAARLGLGRSIDIWSLTLTAAAPTLLLWAPTALPLVRSLLVISIIAGIAQKVIALRVAFDAQIFAGWVQSWTTSGEPSVDATLAAFDQALAANGLRNAPLVTRDLASRIRGAQSLATQQTIVFGGQVASWLGAVMVAMLT